MRMSSTIFYINRCCSISFHKMVPGIAVGDVNNDGLEDMFVGGSYRLPAHLMIQNARGNFTIKEFVR